ncbi:mitochondrial amidoxime-reducing component 1 isoform X2 [Siphateles boraxobius]|uniref:mitochondrial amidoxime-reducing component 1 isoform X2 n=1 Tax=Siphateles boraxobius TaxID=180520 RepID=UPI004062DE38
MQILFPKTQMDFKEMIMKIFDQNRQIALCAAGTTVALLGLGVVYKYMRQEKKLTRVGVVTQLLVHPMKSGKVVSVETAECLRMGLKYGELRDRVFSVDVQGRDCGDDVSDWLTRYLESDKAVRLVHFEPHLKAQRPSEKDPLYPKDEKVAYPDAAPIMLMSEASVRDLNSRLDSDVTVFQFRPSIVVSDCEAFTEDTWDHIQIGQVEMKRVVGCGRCLFTTVDPETGVITRKEPLNTLKNYRMTDPNQKTAPILGQYYTVKKTGVLHVGEPVYMITY